MAIQPGAVLGVQVLLPQFKLPAKWARVQLKEDLMEDLDLHCEQLLLITCQCLVVHVRNKSQFPITIGEGDHLIEWVESQDTIDEITDHNSVGNGPKLRTLVSQVADEKSARVWPNLDWV